jgi:hypothetical protein
MIHCDYCGRAAARRIHVDQESWYTQPNRTYVDFDDVADHYKTLSASRYACMEHLAAAYGHVAQAVGPNVLIVLDAEL